jgi:hypothetical protein
MAGFTANCPDLMKADDVLVPYFIVRPKCFPVHACEAGRLYRGSGRIRSLQSGLGTNEAQNPKKVKMISLSFRKDVC